MVLYCSTPIFNIVFGVDMKVLVACEFSGIVRDTFRNKGYNAYSCDIIPSWRSNEYHLQQNVLPILADGWDLMIAHPPCTYICNSGVSWLYRKEGRWDLMRLNALLFYILLNAPIKHICVENPIPHKYALKIIGRKYDQIIQPYQFGHGETKATCFWLKNLPKLKPTKIVEGRKHRIHEMSPSKNRGQLRSITYQGIADAMVQQWGTYVKERNT